MEKAIERDISKANDGVETTRAIVEPVVEEAELQVDAENSYQQQRFFR